MLIGLGLALVLAIIISFSNRPVQQSAPTPELPAGTEQESVEPSAENVDPSFHARVMSLEQEVEAAPTDTSLLLELAHLRQDAHQMVEAAEAYERLLEVAPDHYQARLDLALCYAELGRWNDALLTTEAVLVAKPNDPAALYNIGAIHANQENFEDARVAWERVAAQTEDADLAMRARQSLSQLSGEVQRPGPVDPTSPLPEGHPEIPTE